MSQPDLNQTEQKKPKVSVCIASYNHARFIGETLDSILAQTYRDFEIVVVDDGSTDNSLEILNSYAEKYPQIKVFTHSNHENRGISVTANESILKSRGEYISFIGSDDIWYPYFLEKQVDFLDKNDVGFIYSKADCINEKGDLLNEVIGADISNQADPLMSVIISNPIPAITVTVRRECLDRVGMYADSVVYGDWELWIRLLNFYKIGFIDEPLAKYRIHGGNTSIGTEPSKHLALIRRVYKHLRDKSQSPEYFKLRETKYQKAISEQLALLPKREAQIYLDRYFIAITKPDFFKAFSALKKAISSSPKTIIRPMRVLAIIKHAVFGYFSRRNPI